MASRDNLRRAETFLMRNFTANERGGPRLNTRARSRTTGNEGGRDAWRKLGRSGDRQDISAGAIQNGDEGGGDPSGTRAPGRTTGYEDGRGSDQILARARFREDTRAVRKPGGY